MKKRDEVMEALGRLLYWFDCRSASFRSRCRRRLWDSARETYKKALKARE